MSILVDANVINDAREAFQNIQTPLLFLNVTIEGNSLTIEQDDHEYFTLSQHEAFCAFLKPIFLSPEFEIGEGRSIKANLQDPNEFMVLRTSDNYIVSYFPSTLLFERINQRMFALQVEKSP